VWTISCGGSGQGSYDYSLQAYGDTDIGGPGPMVVGDTNHYACGTQPGAG
jgi:hypothetical protein